MGIKNIKIKNIAVFIEIKFFSLYETFIHMDSFIVNCYLITHYSTMSLESLFNLD